MTSGCLHVTESENWLLDIVRFRYSVAQVLSCILGASSALTALHFVFMLDFVVLTLLFWQLPVDEGNNISPWPCR